MMQTPSCLSEAWKPIIGMWNMCPIKLVHSYTFDNGENRNNLKSDNLTRSNKRIQRSTCAIRHAHGASTMWKSFQTWAFGLHFTLVKIFNKENYDMSFSPTEPLAHACKTYIVRGWPIKYNPTPSCWVSFNDCKTSSYCKTFTSGIRWQMINYQSSDHKVVAQHSNGGCW